jgi:hypothetical protein
MSKTVSGNRSMWDLHSITGTSFCTTNHFWENLVPRLLLHGDIPQCPICHYGVQRHFTFPHNVWYPFDKCMDKFHSLGNNTKLQWKPVQLLYTDVDIWMDMWTDIISLLSNSFIQGMNNDEIQMSMLLMEYREDNYWKWDFQLQHSLK